jgi:hypothetical protein
MTQSVKLTCKGLFTFFNNLSAVPDGGLVVADNIYIDRNDVAQPRRGFKVFTTQALVTNAKSLHNYQNRILVHQSNRLQYETNPISSPGAFTSYSEAIGGTIQTAVVESPDEASGLKIKSVEANKNLYLTSNKGLLKLDSSTGTILRSGVPQALDFDLELFNQEGFLRQNNSVAYRVVWGYKDANDNLLLSAPSQRQVVYYYGILQFIDDINSMLNEIDDIGDPPFENTYPSLLTTNDTFQTIYQKLKDIVKELNTEDDLDFQEYNAGGRVQVTSVTCRPKSAITDQSYFIINTNTGRYVPWFKNSGSSIPSNFRSLQPDLRLTDTLVEIDINSGVVDADDSEELATFLLTELETANVPINMSRDENTITFRTFYDQVLEPTVDGAVPSGHTFIQIEAGSELTGSQINIETLQEAYNIIVTNLNNETNVSGTPFNESITSKTTSISITIPQEIINLSQTGTNFFYQIYRSAQFPIVDGIVVPPDDELQQIFEDVPTSGEIAAGTVGPIIDETPESFRVTGASLYTSPSQEGIGQSNTEPPFAKDATIYKNLLFLSNTQDRYSLILNLLTGLESSGGSIGFIPNEFAQLVNQGITYKSKLPRTVGNDIEIELLDPSGNDEPLAIVVTGNTISVTLETDNVGAIVTDADDLVAALNSDSDVTDLISINGSGNTALNSLSLTSLSGGTDGTVIEFDNSITDFNITVLAIGESDDFERGYISLVDPTSGTVDPSDDLSPSILIDQFALKIIKAVNRHEDNDFLNAFYLSSFDTLPGQILFKNRYLENPLFTIECDTQVSRDAFNPKIESSDAVASNETKPNRVYYSKFQQPESFPILNYFDVGSGEQPILRILALRDSLFIFKTDGAFRISGDPGIDGYNLTLTNFNSSLQIQGPETAITGNNQIYLFTNEGVTRVTETDDRIISRPIEDKIESLSNTSEFTNFNKIAFGVYYDTEKKYYLFLPEKNTDTVATQCLVYNVFTETWTRLPISKTTGLVNKRDNKLYLGAGDILQLEQERKDYTIFDYADREFSLQLQEVNYDDYEDTLKLRLQSLNNVEIGDVIEQIEYMRPYYFNRVISLLNSNSNVESGYNLLEVSDKSEILTALNALADKLDGDPGVNEADYRANIDAVSNNEPDGVLQKFNILVTQMNSDSGIDQSNFPTFTQTPAFYTHIIDLFPITNEILVQDPLDFEVGNCKVYKAFKVDMVWVPQHAEDPSIWKQFSECNLLFSETIIRKSEIGFTSDVSRNFEMKEMTDDSLAGWGIISWGKNPWGSDEEPRTLRTFIPRSKQRSRYLNPRFIHFRAFEPFLLNGLSLTFDKITSRVTR